MSCGRLWSPRCCPVCGEPLEEWRWPLEPESYVPCLRCAVLYAVTEEGLERVLLSLEAPEIRQVFDELVAAWWSRDPVTQTAAHRRAAA